MLQEALVRLACIMHAASVHPEPGSNSPLEVFDTQSASSYFDRDPASSYHSSVVKVQFLRAEHVTTPSLALSSPEDTNGRCALPASAGVQTIRPLASVSVRLFGVLFNRFPPWRISTFQPLYSTEDNYECQGLI